MANLNQFYKGEAITVTVTDDNGDALEGQYNENGEFDEESGQYAGLRAYPDDLNLENGDTNKIKAFKTSDGKIFTINGEELGSLAMEAGQYTIELIYGQNDASRVIVKSVHAFTIVGSAYKRENE